MNSSPPGTDLRVVRQVAPEEARTRAALVWTMVVGLVLSGVAFAYKIAEFLLTVSSEEARGFADVPVTVYFVVTAGWLCLLGWSWTSGRFADVEAARLDMLEEEDHG